MSRGFHDGIEPVGDWPRFLSGARRTSAETADADQESPRFAFSDVSALVSRKMVSLAIAACLLAAVSAKLVADAPWQSDAPVNPAVDRADTEISNAIHVVEQVERRLDFGGSLSKLAEAQPAFSSVLADAPASPETSSIAETTSDAVSVLIIRNVPEGGSFSTGASAGAGTWVMPAASSDQLLSILGNGFDGPVAAEVEMISNAGVSIGALRLELQKPPQIAMPNVATGNADASIASVVSDVPKPAKQPRQATGAPKTAMATGPRVKSRRLADDSFKAKRPAPVDKSSKVAAIGNPTVSDDKVGPIGKFFAWLNSKNAAPASQDNVTEETKMGLSSDP